MLYGREDEEWDELTREGLRFLVSRATLGRPTSYTELNVVLAQRTGLRPFDFDREDERAAMGHLLGLIVERDRPRTALMISALVNYLDKNEPGPGFYRFAQQLGLLRPGASETEESEFWQDQVVAICDFYSRL